MTIEEKVDCGAILQHFGLVAQMGKTKEELLELFRELIPPYKIEAIADEIADVEIMLEQLKQGLAIHGRVNDRITYKIARTKARIASNFYVVSMKQEVSEEAIR